MAGIEKIFAGAPARLTVNQLADYLSVEPATVRRWIDSGILPAYILPTGTTETTHQKTTILIFRDEVIEALKKMRNV